jgi:hypothetical protein
MTIKVKSTDKWVYPPPRIIYPPTISKKFKPLRIKKYQFRPLRAAGARQPDAEARITMRIAAMAENRYCCGDPIGR